MMQAHQFSYVWRFRRSRHRFQKRIPHPPTLRAPWQKDDTIRYNPAIRLQVRAQGGTRVSLYQTPAHEKGR
ncbi:hypothetical protein HNQ39_005814 [Armatimonas rosea]|uniref:Uncharacterized protein n=1 Tax=Armatimonas rosea TaxID=685828 RepID=A0A7W9SW58_ARMRO|nr:hypothetical protein [Armatimonas rosea]